MSSNATDQTGRLDPTERGAFLGALIGWVFDYYEIFLVSVLVVPIAVEFKLSTEEIGFIFSIQLLFLAIGGVFFGWLADRIGRKSVLILTILIYSIGTMARGLSANYAMLLVFTAFAGLGIGGEYGVGQTLVTETIRRGRRGFFSAFLYGGSYLGIVMGALVGGHLTPVIGWRLTFVLSGLPVLCALWVRRHTPESEIWLQKRAKTPAILALPTGIVGRRYRRTWLLCVLAAALQFFAYYGAASMLPNYLVHHGSSIAGASYWLIFTAFAGAIGCATVAFLSDRIGRRASLSFVAACACFGGLWLAFGWHQLLTGRMWILIPFFILFFGSNGASVFGALFSESFPAEIRATAVSSALQIGRGLSFFPPLIAAFLIPRFGYQSVVFLSAGLFGLLALVAWLFRETAFTETEADVEMIEVRHTDPLGTRA
ncbi:MFS transporter [Acidisoma cellulosilytica]|uniref:MFS transporter n=1 Tax=Acidisoma cellulosilyticum TaxID=2802395 RepID=A0A963Z4F3_9PROT|nr:MFS transporter [Acidisoma cellulosilyticum]MCB8882634.1 MFS transporter [Acidisoma cellulosilyticum]